MINIGFGLFVIQILVFATVSDADDYQCHELLQHDATTPGNITSPFYGKRELYHRNLYCEYRITAPDGYRIKLTFKDFDMPLSEQCIKDRLMIYSKKKESVLDVMCGRKLPFPIMSKEGENEIILLFRSDDNSASGRGFFLQYESSPDFTGYCKDGYLECKNRNCYTKEQICDGVDDCGDGTDETGCITDDYKCRELFQYDATTPGNITSPFYGKREFYHKKLWCEYRITAPEGYRIKLNFKEMDITPSAGCRGDRLTILNEYQNDTLGNFCGYDPPYPFLSDEGQNVIRLLFQTDRYLSGKGFRLEYESSPYFTSTCSEGLVECVNRNCYRSDQKCDGVDDCGDGTDEENCEIPIDTQPEVCSVQEIKPNLDEEGADRMVGGEETIPNSWPWQVSLQQPWSEPNDHFCGGTLINSQWVLTAAHCVGGDPYPRGIRIHMGMHNKFKKTQYEQIRRSDLVITYPNLTREEAINYPREHDIALIKLNAPVKFNKGVQPACLPGNDMIPQPGWRCYVTGWGQTRGSGFAGSLKQHVEIVQKRDECGFHPSQICVGYPKRSLCHGDSGGPLNCKVNGKWYVYGAVSLLIPANWQSGLCGGTKAKTLYASSQQKADWIKEIVNKYS